MDLAGVGSGPANVLCCGLVTSPFTWSSGSLPPICERAQTISSVHANEIIPPLAAGYRTQHCCHHVQSTHRHACCLSPSLSLGTRLRLLSRDPQLGLLQDLLQRRGTILLDPFPNGFGRLQSPAQKLVAASARGRTRHADDVHSRMLLGHFTCCYMLRCCKNISTPVGRHVLHVENARALQLRHVQIMHDAIVMATAWLEATYLHFRLGRSSSVITQAQHCWPEHELRR